MFKIIRLEEDMNIFFIVKKDILSGSFIELPFSVYGFLRVNGSSYINSTVSYKNIKKRMVMRKTHYHSFFCLIYFLNKKLTILDQYYN